MELRFLGLRLWDVFGMGLRFWAEAEEIFGLKLMFFGLRLMFGAEAKEIFGLRLMFGAEAEGCF